MKIVGFILFFSLNCLGQNKIAIIDDFSNSKSHGHLVTKAFTEYQGELKFNPEVVELNIANSHISFKEIINIAIDLKVKVINLSFESVGLEYNYEDYLALKKASDSGIWIVTASGNYGVELSPKHNPVYPCMYRLERLMCIGASKGNSLWSKTNHGSWVYAFVDGTFKDQIATSFSAPKMSQSIMLYYDNLKSNDFARDLILTSYLNKDLAIVDLKKIESQILFEKNHITSNYRGPL